MISTPSLLNRESFEEVLSIAGVHIICSPLLPIMVGKTKQENLLQELHYKDDGEGMLKLMGEGMTKKYHTYYFCESRTKFVRANKMNSGNAHKRNRKHKHKFLFVFATHKINSGIAPVSKLYLPCNYQAVVGIPMILVGDVLPEA